MKLFKKLAAAALAAVLALSMVGCGGGTPGGGATMNDTQETALATLVNTDRKAASKDELERSADVEAILAIQANAMVNYLLNQNDEMQAAGVAATQETTNKLSQLKIGDKKIDMNQSTMMALGLVKGVTATPERIKNAAMNSIRKDGEAVVTVDTWTPVINADGSYLAVVWAEKDGATAVIVMNIVLK